MGEVRSQNAEGEGEPMSLPVALRRVLAFLADRASFLAGGGDMRLVGSVVVLLRAGDFTILASTPFDSTLEWPVAGQFVP